MKDTITRGEFVHLLKCFIDEQRTTTLYVRTDDNQLIVVGLAAGEIVSLRCGHKRGEQAIPLIRSMNEGRYRLDDASSPHRNVGITLPPNEELLLLLEENEATFSSSDCEWAHDALCDVLSHYMGPIAPVLCKEAIAAVGGIDSPTKVRQVVERLAREMDRGTDANRFREQVQTRLARLQR